MLSCQNLFAYDAKYHRSCYAGYISKRNIQVVESKLKSEPLNDPVQKGFTIFCKEVEHTLCFGKKEVLHLTEMNARFIEIFRSVVSPGPDSYRSWKLKEKLKGYFRDRLIFISQSGKSDLVCSKELSLGDVLTKVDEINFKNTDDSTEFAFSSNNECDESDSVILHRAADIVRRIIANVSFISDFYPSSGDLVMEKCVEFVPTALLEFISWCTSDKAFANATCNTDGYASDTLVKTIAICHNIIGLSHNIATPISFGLGIHLHHKFGSWQLIETLHGLGHSIPYDEVRRFMTSVAEEDEHKDGTYIPRGIVKYKQGDWTSIIDAALDNFDQHEETLDGLSTTHFMAAVLYQITESSGVINGIPRSQKKTLHASQYMEKSLSIFNKPHIRPEPKRVAEESIFSTHNVNLHWQVETYDLDWKLCRNTNDMTFLPAWSGFNAMVSQTDIPVPNVRYLPFISAPPSNFSTVYTAILRLISVAKSQGQPHILVTADLAIYSKAQQII